MRLDVYLVKGQWFASRTLAAEAIRKGWVKVDGQLVNKPSLSMDEMHPHVVEISTDELCPYVSRGGLKLEKAIHDFNLNLKGMLVLDVGASTGGFTDCALKNGAARVWAVDVGTSQLHASLRAHPQVVSLEKTDIRTLYVSTIGLPPVDLVVCDVSFISLRHIIPHLSRFLKPEGESVLLIKPQFEAGPGYLNKSGLVKDLKIHFQVLRSVVDGLLIEGYILKNLTYAPLQGKEHNIEYLALVGRKGESWVLNEKLIEDAFEKNGW
ncbi:MAG: rRNA (cytidine1920-2-O)/16S rRNA (cytidine1409-2-O)-methyltransferase [Bacteroidales bacterium]|jgi:23S rRNA (cytidine1920-2'-O)/16S rRNA (cytidine1409-2'-O)-methyltransferase|nr:rRNA (cytidine1920-2-O)/16S rRNA (cytidine1409-2-O)-methyltransferase [Bacteroidales bacterium]MDN5330758.1 rRNA (cytidine1920-2-O)/16S rRNA (cytidine1409-2-O)-methyltransferase [Bacteroidales bacterium]